MSNIMKVICNQCKKEFKINTKPSMRKQENYYCCRECYELSKRKYINIKCKQYNKEFEVRIHEKQFKYFCYNDCEENYKLNNKFTVKNCEQCNKEIITFKAGMKNKRYCSLECKVLHVKNNKIVTKICEWCEKEFQTHNTFTRFCSTSCGAKNSAKEMGFGILIKSDTFWDNEVDEIERSDKT